MADQLIAQRKYDEAELTFKQLNKLDSENVQYIIALAELLKVKREF